MAYLGEKCGGDEGDIEVKYHYYHQEAYNWLI